jgi:hypothetical protein
MKNRIQKAISEGIHFLANEQREDGSFLCLVTPTLNDYSKIETCPAIVPANIVLSSLAHIPKTETVTKITSKLIPFLLSQKGEYWSYNYWFRESPEFKALPYPDDLDDTFCALAALYEYDSTLFDGEAMAKIATMLTSAEMKEGGPYNMWLVPPEGRSQWHDVDLVVNSNIGYFLSLQDIRLPGLDAHIDSCIEEKKYSFPYCSDYPGLYFISRFYEGTKKKEMIDYLVSKREEDGKWENPLQTALAVSALLNLSSGTLHSAVTKSIEYLLREQRDGHWKPYSFFFQMKTPEKTLYAGSSSTTTALCLEALQKFTEATEKEIHQSTKKEEDQERHYKKILYKVCLRFRESGEYVGSTALNIIDTTIKSDTDKQIALLPYYFGRALVTQHPVISSDLLIALGAANMYGWISYTIYDKFLDGISDPKTLPVAMISLRESYGVLSHLLPMDTGFPKFSRKVFNMMDEANAWEIATCRFNPNQEIDVLPDFGDLSKLADRSIGHALGPLAILFILGYREESREIVRTIHFFKQYLIARQLDDDAHDWEEDFQAGRMTWVLVKLLEDCTSKSPTLEHLRTVFWNQTIVTVSNEMLERVAKSRKELYEISHLITSSTFEDMLAVIEKSALAAQKEHREIAQFLSVYETQA